MKLYDTLLIRITKKDIVLDSGGFFEEITLECMNESLAAYGFKVTAKVAWGGVAWGGVHIFRWRSGVGVVRMGWRMGW